MEQSEKISVIQELDALLEIIQWLENRNISDLEHAKKSCFVPPAEVSHWISKADLDKPVRSKKTPPLRLWKRLK